MNFSNMSHIIINKLIFIINHLFNKHKNLSNILNQHVGKILEINVNDCLLRFIINNEGIFEVAKYDNKNPSMIVTCNESIIEILKSINHCDFSSVSKFMHVSGDLQFMSDMSILLKNIELIPKDESYKIIESLMSNVRWILNKICNFGYNLSSEFNWSFCEEFDILADKIIYKDFKKNIKSIYIDTKKTRIRVNNLCRSIDNIVKIDC
ncbi:hypothetical protein CONE_0275 [Candidatus Kinetoplastibacterium oncopeltii TCC290E]|uniref:Uncharacterized protein n=1 Tax=Candidatus Kinetoplastidibacterium stringomonadis TCC290E TaxID=1208920 RepID=M1LVH1_9PROT|nr:hypothetical protein [Candidatus Kinetoplastibacterium oncopeltii]AGF48091.1 hypothetical protein CONE_0275 [Candidatus Kinetoplastibacterium oncopeltii TCC290E]